jgi:hypothetical protein
MMGLAFQPAHLGQDKIIVDLRHFVVVLSGACRKKRNINAYCFGKAGVPTNRLNPDPPGTKWSAV